MAAQNPPRNAAHRRAMDQFAQPRQPSATIQHELAQARKAADANTAKLKALRLARDEADREAKALAAANAPPKKARKPRVKTDSVSDQSVRSSGARGGSTSGGVTSDTE